MGTLIRQVRFFDYNGVFDINYEYLFGNRNHKNKKIRYEIAYGLHEYPAFQSEWEGKWEYILSIPKLAPKKFSKDSFVWSVYKNRMTMPDEWKSKVAEEVEKILSSGGYLSEAQRKQYNEIADVIGAEFKNMPWFFYLSVISYFFNLSWQRKYLFHEHQ